MLDRKSNGGDPKPPPDAPPEPIKLPEHETPKRTPPPRPEPPREPPPAARLWAHSTIRGSFALQRA
jgi:hypothetical protein